MMSVRYFLAILGVSITFLPQIIFAQANTESSAKFVPETDLSLDVSIGSEYDTNVTISDIDLASGLDDYTFTLRAKGALTYKPIRHVVFKGSYIYSAKNYNEFSKFDQNYHLVNTDISRRFGKTRIGVVGRYLNAALDGDAYLESVQGSPYISHYFGKKYFGRAYYTYSDKTYKSRPERDGTSQILGADIYRFLNGTRRFLIAGYRFEDVKAFEQQLGYSKHRVQADFLQRFALWDQDTTLKATVKYEARDYKDINFVINDIRRDDRMTYGVSWKIPFASKAYVEFDYKYRDYNSNLAVVDYNKSVAGIKIGNVF